MSFEHRRDLARAQAAHSLAAPAAADRRLEALILAWYRHDGAANRDGRLMDRVVYDPETVATHTATERRHARRADAAARAALASEPATTRGLLLQAYLMAALTYWERSQTARPEQLAARYATVLDLPRPFG